MVAVMQQRYAAHAERSGKWWVLTVPDLPGAVSQVRSPRQAEEYLREAIAFIASVPADSFELSITVTGVPGVTPAAVEATRRRLRAAEEAQKLAAAGVQR